MHDLFSHGANKNPSRKSLASISGWGLNCFREENYGITLPEFPENSIANHAWGFMAKRLTDTAKWKNPWFRSLPTKYKLLFLYLLDECDNAGVLHLDWELIDVILKEEFDVTEFERLFGDKFCYVGDQKIIIKKFMLYQDNYNSPMMRKHTEKLLRSHGIWEDYDAGKFR